VRATLLGILGIILLWNYRLSTHLIHHGRINGKAAIQGRSLNCTLTSPPLALPALPPLPLREDP
jgi:hypothetical protein